jgi:hypothetical protein
MKNVENSRKNEKKGYTSSKKGQKLQHPPIQLLVQPANLLNLIGRGQVGQGPSQV